MGVLGTNEMLARLRGLDEREVRRAREEYGDNHLEEKKRRGFLREFVANFGDPIIKILLIALCVNIVIKLREFDWYESIGIAVAILVSTFVSTLSEYGNESAFEKLQQEALTTKCRVKRAEGLCEISAADVVVGDFVLLVAGDRIPADGMVYLGEISVDQSPVNGESKEAYKSASLKGGAGTEFADPARLFRGCIVVSGEAVMLVKSVGLGTFYGQIAHEVQEQTRESPLKARLGKLAGSISKFGYLGASLVAIANLFYLIVIRNGFNLSLILNTLHTPPLIAGYLIQTATLAISVIVVAIPEGLPLMITVVLSSNMKRMLKDNVLVRKLVGIETSGNLNILFTDKTGTITKGKLRAAAFVSGSGEKYETFSELSKTRLGDLARLSAVYNSGVSWGRSGGKGAAVGGNSTERTLYEFVSGKNTRERVRVIRTIPFNSARKYSAAQVDGDFSGALYKGAPEILLPRCTHYYDEYGNRREMRTHGKLTMVIGELTGSAHRLIALAIGEVIPERGGIGEGLTLVGVVAIRDQVRREAKRAISEVTRAGVQVVMITGDNRETAMAIGREIGLIHGDAKTAVLTSEELRRISDEALKARIPQLRVVARAVPSDKSRLVKAAQELGMIAGMTGDGINDAPALKKADVGFSMGSGTEVAKEASDIVILDDNFLSISKAILYGRTIFKSIRKFIVFQLTINLCAVGISVIGPFIGINSPITVLQMLWVNMVMDTLAGLAFAGEPPLEEYMREPPKRLGEPIINRYMYHQILTTGIYVTALCVAFFKIPAISAAFTEKYFMTAFFAMFIFAGVAGSFNARTSRLNLFAGILKNRAFMIIMLLVVLVQFAIIYYGGSIFRTMGLSLDGLRRVILLSLTVIPVDLARKIMIKKRARSRAI